MTLPFPSDSAGSATSDFSVEAKGYLARLMIRHGVGVRARTSYVIKTVDEDYFADLTAG